MIRLADNSKCTGCGACHDTCKKDAIKMKINQEGFYFPEIDSSRCIECKACQIACPMISGDEVFNESIRAYYGRNRASDPSSSSGGIFGALASVLLKEGGVIYGATLQHDTIKHISISNDYDLKQLFGSKYAQSSMMGIYRDIDINLSADKKVLFSGCPCQCAAVSKYFKKHKNKKNLYICEIMCHGTPSPGIFADWIKYWEQKKRKKVINYNFRSKQNGWENPSVKISFSDGTQLVQYHFESNYHNWFGLHLSLRESCYSCRYRNIKRVADITIGDFWGIKAIPEPKINVSQGVSAVIINTIKGEQLLKAAQQSSDLELYEITIEEAYVNNAPSLSNFEMPVDRTKFFAEYEKNAINGLLKQYPGDSKMFTFLRKIKRFIKK